MDKYFLQTPPSRLIDCNKTIKKHECGEFSASLCYDLLSICIHEGVTILQELIAVKFWHITSKHKKCWSVFLAQSSTKFQFPREITNIQIVYYVNLSTLHVAAGWSNQIVIYGTQYMYINMFADKYQIHGYYFKFWILQHYYSRYRVCRWNKR